MKNLILIINFGFLFLISGCLESSMQTSGLSIADLASADENTINVRDTGALGNGIKDDTAAIQKAVDEVPVDGTVYVPAGKYMINAAVSIELKDNMKFKMSPDATLAVIPNDLERHRILSLEGRRNIEISGGKLLGDRDQHQGTTGEWGYGINVGGKAVNRTGSFPAYNILIRDIHISKFWGDGVQVGGMSDGVIIRNIVSTMNRRQGLSITQATNVSVYDSEFSFTEGTPPEYGIDIEPDANATYLARNILIENCNIHHNKGGILVYKKTYDIVLKNNYIAHNAYGIYTVDSSSGTITGNTLIHNLWNGVYIGGSTDNYTIDGNIFRNNGARFGIITDAPVVTITDENSTTAKHFYKGAETSNIFLRTNQYAE